jgi:hypothetical protein
MHEISRAASENGDSVDQTQSPKHSRSRIQLKILTWPKLGQMDTENRHPKTASALNLRSHSIDKLNHYDRRIPTQPTTIRYE